MVGEKLECFHKASILVEKHINGIIFGVPWRATAPLLLTPMKLIPYSITYRPHVQ